jgi:hypothetical protein
LSVTRRWLDADAICSVFMAGASSPASLRASRSRRLGKETNRSDLFKKPAVPFAFALILADAILVALIIAYVPCESYLPPFFFFCLRIPRNVHLHRF